MVAVSPGLVHKRTRRRPLPFLVNAVLNEAGQWALPLPPADLLFWAWQRWEVEVAHRELKSNFGLGNKQCWQPTAAVLSVQWSAWVYALLLLAGYRTWGLTGAPAVPTRWWQGSGRWSLNTLWRGYRAALWGNHQFHPIDPRSLMTRGDLRWIQPALRHARFDTSNRQPSRGGLRCQSFCVPRFADARHPERPVLRRCGLRGSACR